MGITLSLPQAKVLGVGSYAINFIAQQIGMQSKPNMLDIHNQNLAAFSPYPYAIPLFFGGHNYFKSLGYFNFLEILQLLRDQLNYLSVYALGNLAIAVWLFFWNKNRLDISQILVTINSLSNLYYVAFILPPKTYENRLTHYVAKTLAGIGILDFLHNGSAAFFKGIEPSTAVKIFTGIGTLISVGSSDYILGACIAYD